MTLHVLACVDGSYVEVGGVYQCQDSGGLAADETSVPLEFGFSAMTGETFVIVAEFAVFALVIGFGIKAIRRLFNA